MSTETRDEDEGEADLGSLLQDIRRESSDQEIRMGSVSRQHPLSMAGQESTCTAIHHSQTTQQVNFATSVERTVLPLSSSSSSGVSAAANAIEG